MGKFLLLMETIDNFNNNKSQKEIIVAFHWFSIAHGICSFPEKYRLFLGNCFGVWKYYSINLQHQFCVPCFSFQWCCELSCQLLFFSLKSRVVSKCHLHSNTPPLRNILPGIIEWKANCVNKYYTFKSNNIKEPAIIISLMRKYLC